MSDWLANSPVSSVIGIVIVVALVLIVLKLVKSITRPLLIITIVVGAVLVLLGIVDLTLLAATGKKLVGSLFESAKNDAKEAIVNGISCIVPWYLF